MIANVNPAELDESLEVAKKKLKNLRNVLAGKERFEFEKLELKSSLETEFSLQKYSKKLKKQKTYFCWRYFPNDFVESDSGKSYRKSV